MQTSHHPPAVGQIQTLAAGQTRTLAVGQTQTLAVATPSELHVLPGVLWLTQSGDPTDYFVRAGQSMTLAGTLAVVQAEGGRPAAYMLQAPSALAGQPRTLLQPEAAH